jgi:hypothetical protein
VLVSHRSHAISGAARRDAAKCRVVLSAPPLALALRARALLVITKETTDVGPQNEVWNP